MHEDNRKQLTKFCGCLEKAYAEQKDGTGSYIQISGETRNDWWDGFDLA